MPPGSLEEASEVLVGVKVHSQEKVSRSPQPHLVQEEVSSSPHLVHGEGLVEVGSNQETKPRSVGE